MSQVSASETKIRMEIWRSFVGVLRSYATIANPPASVHSVEDDAIGDVVLEAGTAYLSFAFDAADGRGSLRLMMASSIEAEERFELKTDGTVRFDDAPEGAAEELDHAAIRLIASLSRAGTRNDIEVPA